jgi:hypothetical protein
MSEDPLRFRPMLAGDAVLLDMQPAQQLELGIEHPCYTLDEGEELAAHEAWTAYRGSRIVGIAGFKEMFCEGSGHALAWATLSAEIGADHLAITRFARFQLEHAPYHRIEAIVDADNRRAVKWATLVGLHAAHVLGKYGPQAKPHILFERVR